MAGAAQRQSPKLSVGLFRGFLEGRPDEERWELVDGVPVRLAPPTLAHAIIAANLQRVLNEAFARQGLGLIACQGAGVNLAPPIEHYDPQPDVMVIDAATAAIPATRYAEQFLLAAEIASSSDSSYVDTKPALYQQQASCRYVLTVQQDRFEIRVDSRPNETWSEQHLSAPDNKLIISEFGLRCTISELYRGTALLPLRSGKQ